MVGEHLVPSVHLWAHHVVQGRRAVPRAEDITET